MLGRSFEDDPVSCFTLPDPAQRARGLPRYFAAELRSEYLRSGEVLTTAGLEGASLWAPPGRSQVSLRAIVALVPMVPLVWHRLLLVGRALASIEAKRPKEPHWYLGVLGTDPAHQGKGVGSALMAPVLERCDREGHPAYLESSKERNVAFYARHGFEVTEELDTPRGGPRLWLMWRKPR